MDVSVKLNLLGYWCAKAAGYLCYAAHRSQMLALLDYIFRLGQFRYGITTKSGQLKLLAPYLMLSSRIWRGRAHQALQEVTEIF